MCSSDVNVSKGKVLYTHMLNSRGGIGGDITINRLEETKFLIISSATTHSRDKNWIERNLLGYNATLTDVTSGYTVLSLQGPKSREILEKFQALILTIAHFRFQLLKKLNLGMQR